MKKNNDERNKIGICTLYYNNQNYGANLQAYALCRAINSLGYDSEQISFINTSYFRATISRIKLHIFSIFRKSDILNKNLKNRSCAIARFRNSIPHSKLFYANTIDKANLNYDCFVVGSDQVWNPDWINRFMSLEFAVGSKQTVAYSASLGKVKLDPDEQNKLKVAIEHTDYISLREKESIPALRLLTDKPIEHTLDPTLLLTKSEWDEICSKRIIDEDYLFCYFLRDDENLRTIANQYAREHNLKIATIPYLNGKYREVDDGFGDFALFEVNPNDFISLIKYASFILTDSFHGAVFSHLYEKKHIVTNGRNNNEMGCRMQSLTELFGTERRFVENSKNITPDLLHDLTMSPLEIHFDDYEIMRKKSMQFLGKALKQ